MNYQRTVDTLLLTMGTAYSLANIEQVLGIIILVLQIGWILTKLTLKVIHKVRNKEPLNDIGKTFTEAIEDVTTIKEKFNDKGNKK